MVKKISRQQIRRIIIYISFILFPITFYYFSPYLIIEGASQGIITGSFIIFTLFFVIALFFGRLFCGWICPAGGLQRLCFKFNNKNLKANRRDWIKYFIWTPWIAIIVLMFFRAGGVKSVDPLYQTYFGVSVSNIYSLILFIVIAGLIALIAVISGKRGFCHYFCWMAPFMIIGRKIRNIFKWPALHLEASKNKCIDCKTCSKNCPMSLDVNSMVQNEYIENLECILCGTCVDTCPENVIKYSF
jgi:polyferredoxin